MTKADAEQHAAVWGLADQLLTEEYGRLESMSEDYCHNILALSILTKYIAQAYTVMAESIVE